MILVQELILGASVYDIVLATRTEAAMRGRFVLHDIRDSADTLYVTCPWHAGGQERHPSCGVAKYGTSVVEAGHAHCFRCSASAPLTEFVSMCFGHRDKGAAGIFWLRKNFANYSIEARKLHMRPYQRYSQKKSIVQEDLSLYRHHHPYMYKRGLTDDLIQEFEVGYDSATESLTFPVYDSAHNLMFVQRRGVKDKTFHNAHNAPKREAVYAIHKACRASGPIYVCESILDALTVWKYGSPAVALLGASPTQEQVDVLCTCKARRFILALDNDAAGMKGSWFLYEHLKYQKLVSRVQWPSYLHDMNDTTIEDFHQLLVVPMKKEVNNC